MTAARSNLAMTRIFFFTCVYLTVSGPDYFLHWAHVPSEFWHPVGILHFFSTPLPSEFVTVSFHVWRWLTLACLLGVFYRWTAPVWWVLGLVVITNGHSFSYLDHVYMPVVLAALPLCFSRAGDAFSFDRWLRPDITPHDTREYTLPVRTIQIVFVLTYFAAGISKLRFGGTEWITGDTLRNYLIRASLTYADSNQLAHMARLNEVFFRTPWLCNVMAFFAVALELSAPLAVVKRRWALIIVPSIAVLQIGIFFTIFVRFTPYIALLGAWVNWHWIFNRIRQKPLGS